MNIKATHLEDDQLAALALGQSSVEVVAHLDMCDVCRAEANVYRSILQSTQRVFCDDLVPVNLLRCEQNLWTDNSSWEVNDRAHELRISLTRIDGLLHGQLIADVGPCTCWHDAPVRLFDGIGLVSSTHVSSDGEFHLAVPDSGGRYSLGLVLPRQGVPELQIIGHIDRG